METTVLVSSWIRCSPVTAGSLLDARIDLRLSRGSIPDGEWDLSIFPRPDDPLFRLTLGPDMTLGLVDR